MIAINPSTTAQGKAHSSRAAFASHALRPRYTKWHSKSYNSFRCRASSEGAQVSLVSQALTAKASTMAEVKKYLLGVGWDIAWVDGVTSEIMKTKLDTNAEKCKSVVEYLQSLGIKTNRIENMVSIAKQIFAKSPEELRTVVEWLTKKDVAGEELAHFLETNPTVLTYSVSSNESYLENGKARISLVRVQHHGEQVPGIIQWRDGAQFATAPVSPRMPN
eukprot:jgi/Picsp_1/4715/NSC_02084-R1_mitochondrial transcription termination factor